MTEPNCAGRMCDDCDVCRMRKFRSLCDEYDYIPRGIRRFDDGECGEDGMETDERY